jgi:hypothetical protein
VACATRTRGNEHPTSARIKIASFTILSRFGASRVHEQSTLQ